MKGLDPKNKIKSEDFLTPWYRRGQEHTQLNDRSTKYEHEPKVPYHWQNNGGITLAQSYTMVIDVYPCEECGNDCKEYDKFFMCTECGWKDDK